MVGEWEVAHARARSTSSGVFPHDGDGGGWGEGSTLLVTCEGGEGGVKRGGGGGGCVLGRLCKRHANESNERKRVRVCT